MNKSALKKYAPQARLDFIDAVTRRAETLGLNPNNPGTVEHDGDAMLINGQPFPAGLKRQRETLQQRIAEQGFDAVMDAIAYTWFNRLVAIRYMELHDFLGHGYRVLSHPQGHAQPEILDHVADLDLDGMDRQRALDLKLAGNRDEDLYREVLLAQCHALHTAMPFLFESIDDATELLLPDGLLRTDSLIRELVTAIDEASWQDVEIIGWLYQFYISEKKSQVIGKVVKSEDIPAATQLFTPNWIVKYLVQNSLGRLWLMANPTSTLANQWDYYIQPAEQTPEVNALLDELIQTRIAEDGNTLNPESLTLLDPACGSGHILVEAYNLLRDIYLERGYRRRDIPRLILEKNLYGLEIDDRAAQLAGFALLMKARADNRRLFGQPVILNVVALQEAKEGSAGELHSALNTPQIDYSVVSQLVETFVQAKTFGSLIQISDKLASALPDVRRELEAVRDGGDMLGRDMAKTLLRLVAQAEVLANQFDAVVANPPYMGSKGMNAALKTWAKKTFPASKADLFAMFIERGFGWCKGTGFNSMVTMQSWMFLSSYEQMRTRLLEDRTISTLAHLGARAFSEISGEVVQATAFALQPQRIREFRPAFFRLVGGIESVKDAALRANQNRFDSILQDDLIKIPGSPVAYWTNTKVICLFKRFAPLETLLISREGLTTGSNDRFLRLWSEVNIKNISFGRTSSLSLKTWLPYIKGGNYRRWEGNREYVLDWSEGGEHIFTFSDPDTGRIKSHNYNGEWALKVGMTWSSVAGGDFCVRHVPGGFMFDTTGTMAFANSDVSIFAIEALLNSVVARKLMEILSPSYRFQPQQALGLPVPRSFPGETEQIARECVRITKEDWDYFERSWDFQRHPLIMLRESSRAQLLGETFESWVSHCDQRVSELQRLEIANNDIFIRCYGLESVLKSDVLKKDVTITSNPAYRYESTLTKHELFAKFRASTAEELVSYATGCMMGRYSLDTPGLIYAHAGNEGFDQSQYQTFPADADGIVPITDEAWFGDDGANRIREFVRVVWGEDTESENMTWLAESLGTQRGESADDTIRRYLSKQFYKDHLQTYKKRPIYWLFSSGKHKAFEALVYLHRYNAGTLSRMRMEYVVPLQSRMQSRIDSLEQDIPAAASSAETRRLQKQRNKLAKQLDELRRFDESLRHYADQRITLDLDDGVKVNYGKFGDLLAEVKAVTGKAPLG